MQPTEHRAKYEALARRLGVDALLAIMPATPEQIREAYSADKHLNNIPLSVWDRAAGRLYPNWGEDDCRVSWISPFTPDAARGLSLAERVCVLKHVAVTRICGAERDGLDIE